MPSALTRLLIYALIPASGFAALSWEVIWQLKSSLALGVSAWGTAITLAITMGGMGLGGFGMGRALRNGSFCRPGLLYGALELVIGLSGLLLNDAFRTVESLDGWIYSQMPQSALFIHIAGIAIVLGIPAICMGATLPVFGIIAKQFRLSLAVLYGLNTLGAALGVLCAAFFLIPWFGLTHTMAIIAAINVLTGFLVWVFCPNDPAPANAPQQTQSALRDSASRQETGIVMATGFATFTLEVAWFRSLASTFSNTTDVFAIMLASVLIALGLAASSVPKLKRKHVALSTLTCVAGILILLATPLVEHFDLFLFHAEKGDLAEHARNALAPDGHTLSRNAILLYIANIFLMFCMTFCTIAPPIWFLGIAFPWIFDASSSSNRLGVLYAVNTVAAVAGSLCAAWIFLPAFGFARTAWLAGALVVTAGIWAAPAPRRLAWATAGAVALLTAFSFETGVGTARVQGYFASLDGKRAKVLEFYEGPDATVSVAEYYNGGRRLLINSASAAMEAADKPQPCCNYMAWMGHLPMLLHPHPENALVICFGTGQTSNAVRRENPGSLDIVDINKNIFRLAHNFKANEDVLHDPKVHAIVMDGRAYMRRTTKTYDVITLEPMPPTNAGVNNLYSREFYALARSRLRPDGVIAQWLPFYAVSPHSAASIARTFNAVFPHSVLWVDYQSHDGILLGMKSNASPLPLHWPGFTRALPNAVPQEKVINNVALDSQALKRYGAYGEVISDDNQMLAYGKALYAYGGLVGENFVLLHQIDAKIAVP